MDFFDVVRRRRTMNSHFTDEPVSAADQRLLMELAGRAPSQLNSQPWRFVLIESRETIEAVARISGESMTESMARGAFFDRYKPFFRFSPAEMERHRDGMLFDRLPAPLRPFTRQVFTKRGRLLMNALRVPQTLGAENRKLVAGAPLLLGVMLDRSSFRPDSLTSFYSTFSMGAAMENVWLATVPLGLGIQFISFPMELPERWAEIERLLAVPDDLELMAVYRIGHVPAEKVRPAIDWVSDERKVISQYVFREDCTRAQEGWDAPPQPVAAPGGGAEEARVD
ncbi:nitroreductase [Frigoribacterium sp. Leaf263]|uniref:nitroreductase family protein n=1 Tax=Frigoribacterium sp. Leaf263 TaxID=1736313 RepID=UPI0006F9E9BE|nr:nitroreductase family protein [Frigoribacterium sp. Leaf263]KQO84557.1 nitroreductase [Frigoribacterium sp. Leaf263]